MDESSAGVFVEYAGSWQPAWPTSLSSCFFKLRWESYYDCSFSLAFAALSWPCSACLWGLFQEHVIDQTVPPSPVKPLPYLVYLHDLPDSSPSSASEDQSSCCLVHCYTLSTSCQHQPWHTALLHPVTFFTCSGDEAISQSRKYSMFMERLLVNVLAYLSLCSCALGAYLFIGLYKLI